jgi:hypothetical protein
MHIFHRWAMVSFQEIKSEPVVKQYGKIQKSRYELVDICVDCGKRRVTKVLSAKDYLPL